MICTYAGEMLFMKDAESLNKRDKLLEVIEEELKKTTVIKRGDLYLTKESVKYKIDTYTAIVEIFGRGTWIKISNEDEFLLGDITDLKVEENMSIKQYITDMIQKFIDKDEENERMLIKFVCDLC